MIVAMAGNNGFKGDNDLKTGVVTKTRPMTKRPSLYKILSKRGNPTLATLQEILKPLGMRVSVALDEVA